MAERPIDIEQLIVDRLGGDISPEDDRLLEERLRSDENARKLWEESSLALQMYQASAFAKNVPTGRRFRELLQKIGESDRPISASSMLRWARVRRIGKPAWVAAAVMIPVLVTVAWLLFRPVGPQIVLSGATPQDSVLLLLDNGERLVLRDEQPIQRGAMTLAASQGTLSTPETHPISANKLVIHVPKGKTYQLELSDGTRVRLNADSRFEFHDVFVGAQREVRLEGEAFFEVVRDEGKPFVVTTDDMSVEVLGTSFNLRSYKGSSVQASLVSGRVRARSLHGDFQHLDLSPGMAAVGERDGRIRKVPFDSQVALGWLDGVYFFNNERLEDIMATVNRLSGHEIVFEDARIADTRFSGAYERDKPISFLMDHITSSSSVAYSVKGSVVSLRK